VTAIASAITTTTHTRIPSMPRTMSIEPRIAACRGRA
jgi:hypothetical protein